MYLFHCKNVNFVQYIKLNPLKYEAFSTFMKLEIFKLQF